MLWTVLVMVGALMRVITTVLAVGRQWCGQWLKSGQVSLPFAAPDVEAQPSYCVPSASRLLLPCVMHYAAGVNLTLRQHEMMCRGLFSAHSN